MTSSPATCSASGAGPVARVKARRAAAGEQTVTSAGAANRPRQTGGQSRLRSAQDNPVGARNSQAIDAWAAKKKAKIERAKQLKELRGVDESECTFKPRLRGGSRSCSRAGGCSSWSWSRAGVSGDPERLDVQLRKNRNLHWVRSQQDQDVDHSDQVEVETETCNATRGVFSFYGGITGRASPGEDTSTSHHEEIGDEAQEPQQVATLCR